MLGDKQLLVVTDDPEMQRTLAIILNFVGERPHFQSLAEWRTCLGLDQVGAVMVAGGTLLEQFHHELPLLEARYGNIPIIALGAMPLPTDDAGSTPQRLLVEVAEPLQYTTLVDALHRAQRFGEAVRAAQLSQERRPIHLFRSLVGTSRQIQTVRTLMGQVADKDVTVLILGESGTGKEVVARNLHYHSPRREKPFVPVNCGAIPAELLESELFGHEKGAFTGAISARAGRFELAEGGTLFLDEIGDMPLHMQVKILRVLQEKSFERVGGNKSFATDVRIIAATHRNLEEMIEEGRFREDLYYRLNVFPIEMPSLQARAEDIPLLLNELISRLESEQRGTIRFNSAAILSLCRHPWPGNVRELANLVERMAIIHPHGVIGVQDLPPRYRHVAVDEELPAEAELAMELPVSPLAGQGRVTLPEQGLDLKEYISGLEQSLIQQALDDSGGVVARAAERLAMRRTTLVEKMRKYGMQR